MGNDDPLIEIRAELADLRAEFRALRAKIESLQPDAKLAALLHAAYQYDPSKLWTAPWLCEASLDIGTLGAPELALAIQAIIGAHDSSATKRLGIFLGQHADRTAGGLRLAQCGKSPREGFLYRIEPGA